MMECDLISFWSSRVLGPTKPKQKYKFENLAIIYANFGTLFGTFGTMLAYLKMVTCFYPVNKQLWNKHKSVKIQTKGAQQATIGH